MGISIAGKRIPDAASFYARGRGKRSSGGNYNTMTTVVDGMSDVLRGQESN